MVSHDVREAWVRRCRAVFPVLVFSPLVGNAQAEADASGAAPIEEIVVTGSRLVRRDFAAPSPIFSLDSDTIGASGQPTLEETLNQMPQVQPDFGRTSNNPGDGTARLNLRGLGANRTLVMLNGRRIAPSGVGSAIDVNMIPQALIERVEVITGGASTVYGSDAVAGVVNFITYEDYEGLAIDAGIYVTEEGDANNYDVNVAWGRNFAGGNLTLFGGYLDRDYLYADARELTSVPLLDTWEGEIVPTGSFNSPVGLITSEQVDGDYVPVAFNPDGTPRTFRLPDDLYNYAPLNYLQVPLERYYGGLMLTRELGAGAEFYTELALTQNEVRQTLAPAQINNNIEVNLDNPLLAPEAVELFADNYFLVDPNTVGFRYQRRLEEFGPRIIDNTNDYTRLVAGVRGEFGSNWDYDVWLSWTKGDEEIDQLNSASAARLQQGLLVDPATGQCVDTSGGCVPLDIFGAGNIAPDQVGFLRYAPFTNTTSREQMLASGFVRGEPLSTWAGPVAVAGGLEWRNDEGHFEADEALFNDDALGYNPDSSVNGEESVAEIYAEALVPLADNLTFARYLSLEVGGRLSEYDNAGSADTWKLGGEWEPVTDLRFRVMKQRSVRAPDLREAFQEQLTDPGEFVGAMGFDPCSADRNPVANGNLDKCVIQGLPASEVGVFQATPFFPTDYISGGNPGLAPETATTFTYGVVYSGFENWMLALDFFDLEVDDTIGTADARRVCFDAGNSSNALCENIQRDPLTYNVATVDERTSNLGKLRTEGFDLQLNYGIDLPAALAIDDTLAGLDINFVWSRVATNSIQPDPSIEAIECAGWFGWTCGELGVGTTVPENRIFASANYTSGRLSAVLSLRWIEGTDNDALRVAPSFGYDPAGVAVQSVDSKTYANLSVGYDFTDKLAARFSVSNLFATEAPLMADAAFANNTDTQMYDIFGRGYRLAFSLSY